MVILYQQINIQLLFEGDGGRADEVRPASARLCSALTRYNSFIIKSLLMSTGRQEKVASLEELYGENDFIDAKDNQGDWRVGYIIARYDTTKVFKVRFDGWPSKYDQNYKFNSIKLKPFRTLVVGYTGQQQHPGIREWKFLQPQHEQRTKQLQAFFANPLGHSTHQINQLLRGHNYLYIDFLMTWKFATPQGLRYALEYFLINIKFLTLFLQQVGSHFQQFLRVQQADPDPASLSPREAFLRSYFEIFDGGFIISGGYARLSSFFRDNGEHLRECLQDGTKRDPKRAYQTYIVSQFVQLGGMKAIEEILEHLLQTTELVPFLFLHSLTSLFHGLSALISTADREAALTKIVKIGETNLERLKEHHFKDLHKHHVSNFLTAVVTAGAGTSLQEGLSEWSVRLELGLALKMIGCPYFERKLKGIGHIQTTCEKNEWVLKGEWFRQWMEEYRLLSVLFVSSDNQQFTRKACQLVKFLNIKSIITDQHIDLIWNSRIGKHETSVKEIYSLVADLPLYETEHAQKLELFVKVAGLPEASWDEDYIKFIKDFSQNSYGVDLREKLGEPYGFDMVYRYTVREQSDFAIGLMTALLQKAEKSNLFLRFQQQCFQSIKEGKQAEVHLKLLLVVCNNRLESFEKLQLDMIGILVTFLLSTASTNNSHLLSNTLQLLTEVVRSVNREMESQQLMALWKQLTPTSHRQTFMRWLFKRKDNGRVILNQALNEVHRSYLLGELWGTEEEAAAMEESEAVLLVELFKSVNTSRQKMKRVNVIIRPLSLELDGYEKLWSVLKYCQHPKVVEAICELLAEVASSYEEAQDLRLAVETLILNIAQLIRESLDLQDIALIRKLLLLTERLMARDEEAFNLSSQPKVSYLREFTVVHRDSKEERIHKFNCMASFYDFKKLLAEKWSLPVHRIQVFNSKHELIRLESYFKSMSENQFTANYRFEIAEAQPQESVVQESLNKELDLFFLLLDDKRIEKEVWSIVERLPISDQLKFRILDTPDILSELQKVGFYKELYELKVMLELGEEWWMRFASPQNLALLVSSLTKAAFATHIELEYLTTLTAILAKMLGLSSLNDLPLAPPPTLFRTSLSLLRLFLAHLRQHGSHSLTLQIRLIRHLFEMAESLRTCLPEQDFLAEFLAGPEAEELLTFGLVCAPHLQLRRKFGEQLKTLFADCQATHWPPLLSLLLEKLLRTVVSFPQRDQLKEYFEFASTCLDRVPDKHLANYLETQGRELCNGIFQLARGERAEAANEAANVALVGYLGLLKHLAPFQSGTVQRNIAEFVLQQCLFSEGECRCKSKKARWEALLLLKSLFVNPAVLEVSCDTLGALHKNGKWRTRRVDDWVITLQDKMKSATGYVGLKNLGCICYMNSFIQQLYMMPSFRSRALAAKDPDFLPQQASQHLLFQLQKMFLNLQLSEKKFYNPKDFCFAFKDYEGNPTNVAEQMDIDEFSGILFDRLESHLKPTRQHSLIKDMFGGVFSNEIVCKGCPHYSETEEQFLSISLTVKHKKNIYQSLDNMIKGDTLDGDNAYFCERCSKKVSAVKRVSLKQLPDYLIVTLKRFQFDYGRMIKLKVNDYCEFPINLNLKEYSRQHLRQQEGQKPQEEEELFPSEYYSYVLKGVVVHLGYADSGHYYSYIQDRVTGKWLEFNDTVVRDFSPEDLPEECFGGQYGGYEAKEKIKNAYMLIYQREVKREQFHQPQQTENQVDDVQVVVKTEIAAQNREHKIQNILFSGEYSRFVNQLVEGVEQYEPEAQKKALKFAITTFLTVTIREKTDSEIHNKLRRLQVQLERVPELKEWVLSLLSEPAVFQELFRNNLIREVKKTLAYWLVDLFPHCSRQAQELFCNLLLTRITEENDNVLEYCLMLYEVALRSPRTLDYLNSKHIIGRFLQNIVRREPRVFTDRLELLSAGQSEIGKEVLIERTPQEQAAKRLKLENENGYVWALVNLSTGRAREKGVELDAYLDPVELQYLWLPDAKIYKILEEIRNKFQMYEFLNFLASLSTGNKEFLGILLAFAGSGLKDFQSKRYRQFFLLFQKLINVQDHLKTVRLSGFSRIIEAVVHNQQYSLDSNIIQQWVVILLNRNQALRNYLANDQATLTYLFKLATKKFPSDEIARKNAVFGEFMVNKYHGVKFLRSRKAYAKMGEDIADFYQQLLENRFVESPHWPSVLETELRELKVGEPVAYFDSKDKIDYEEAKVQSVFLGRVELSLKRNRTLHVWKDDQKLTLDVKLVPADEENDLNSSRTTEMDIDDEEDAFEEL